MSIVFDYEVAQYISLSTLMIAHRGNITQAAKEIGVNRGTLRTWLKTKQKVMLVKDNGKLTPYVSDRRQGHHKKDGEK